MCLEQHPPLLGPESQMHFCPTSQKVPPEAVAVEPSKRHGEPTTEEEVVTGNSWTLTLSTYTNMESPRFAKAQGKSVYTQLKPGHKTLNLGNSWKH